MAWKPWEKKYASQNEYRDAMQLAEDAVLISEHRQAIVQLNAVKAKGLNPSTMDNGLLNNRIIQAKKAIQYLDAEGKSKYTEKGNYGYQWYNIHDGNAYKVFFAHSRKCKSPMITFEYSDTKNGPTIWGVQIYRKPAHFLAQDVRQTDSPVLFPAGQRDILRGFHPQMHQIQSERWRISDLVANADLVASSGSG